MFVNIQSTTDALEARDAEESDETINGASPGLIEERIGGNL